MKKIILTLFTGVALTACNFFEVEPHIITSDQYYKTQDDVLHGLAAVYGVMSNEGFYGKHYTFDFSYVDDLCYVNRPTEDVAELMNVYGHRDELKFPDLSEYTESK